MQKETLIDLAREGASDAVLNKIPSEPSSDLYRLSKEQALRMVDLGIFLSLSGPVSKDAMREQVAGIFDVYSSIPKGAYYSWTGPLPEMTDDFLKANTTPGRYGPTSTHFPIDWISRKRHEGFVTDGGLKFYFHEPDKKTGGCMKTIDRCVEIHWGRYLGVAPLIWPKKTQNCLRTTTALDEEKLRNYLREGFNLIDNGKLAVDQEPYSGVNLGFIPITAYRRLTSGEDLVSFVERFLNFTEEEIPYSEEAFQLQANQRPGNLALTSGWSREELLQEISRRQTETAQQVQEWRESSAN